MVDERDDWHEMAADQRFVWQAGMLVERPSGTVEWPFRIVEMYEGQPGFVSRDRDDLIEYGVGNAAIPDRTDRPTVGAVQGMAEAWCREHGYWISWILDNKATVEIEDELDTKFCCQCDDLATVAARALRWCWAQEVGDE